VDGPGSYRAVLRGQTPSPSQIGPHATRTERLVPREWIEGVARLEQDRPPPDIPRHRWTQFVKDCHAFLNSPQAERAAQLGWHTIALFGCKPGAMRASRFIFAGRKREIGVCRWGGDPPGITLAGGCENPVPFLPGEKLKSESERGPGAGGLIRECKILFLDSQAK